MKATLFMALLLAALTAPSAPLTVAEQTALSAGKSARVWTGVSESRIEMNRGGTVRVFRDGALVASGFKTSWGITLTDAKGTLTRVELDSR